MDIKTDIFYMISDAINIGFDSYTKLLGFCKGLEALGRKDLAEEIKGLYKSGANDRAIKKFVTRNF